MRIRHDLRCLICVFPVFWDVGVLRCNAFLLRNQGTSLVAQHMEPLGLALRVLQSISVRRCRIYPAQQVNRPGAKVGLVSLRAAPCGPCLCRGGQRSFGWRHTLGGTCSARPTLDAMRSPPAAVGELGYELQHIDRRQLILNESQISSALL